jgi:hypothetical protein
MTDKYRDKHQMGSWIILAAFVLIAVSVYFYGNKPQTPEVRADGTIKGNYSTASIMSLGKPYECTFKKSDGISTISGIMHTDSKSFYVEFRIKTEELKNELNSLLLVKGGQAYSWISSKNVGYKSSAAKSAVKGASVAEQAQIIGTRDKVNYTCVPWQADSTLFEIPTSITFIEPK